MAEAFARIHGEGKCQSFSAGSQASGVVNPKAIEAMKQKGYDLSAHRSTKIEELPKISFDYVISMGCGEKCPYVPTKHREDWDIPDPKNMTPEKFSEVRDLIEEKVKALIARL